jgi:hypothetical protein
LTTRTFGASSTVSGFVGVVEGAVGDGMLSTVGDLTSATSRMGEGITSIRRTVGTMRGRSIGSVICAAGAGRDDASGDGVAFGTTVPSGEVRAGRRGIDDIAGDAGGDAG